ncbi:sel1 repeat family protein [Pelomyxa schiedti]|nr:sel1 repeat family protein [Pelomyxa schiedti]
MGNSNSSSRASASGSGSGTRVTAPAVFPPPSPNSNSNSNSSPQSLAASASVGRTRRSVVVGYEAFQRAVADRAAFFTKMAKSTSISDVQSSSSSLLVANNFKLVRPIAHGCNGIVYEVKCTGEGHPALFSDQSYVLKVPFNYGITTRSVHNAFENEYLMASTLEPHANINQYFCHFTDRIPEEYYEYLPSVAKELTFDPVRKRLHACIWVVFEHHAETLEQFLRELNTTPETTAIPWPIVHKYSRDICAALVHLFKNDTIHFDIKLDNIVISSNKEQAILIDLGCATKFAKTDSGSFDIETASLVSVQGNQSHRAPEIINGIARYKQTPDRSSILHCDKQPSFELGCILFELAMCGQHPLPGYPGGYGPSGQITFSFDSEEQFPIKTPDFPKEFCTLVRALLQCDPEKRMPLMEASEVLSNIESPSPFELLSFYSCVVTNDAGALTTKAACQILCGSARDCADTLYKSLECEQLFSPALLLLHYLNSCSVVASGRHQHGIHASLTGKRASFTPADVEFIRAIINKRHRATLPEIIVTALWTRHISHDVETYRNVTQALLKKVPAAAIRQQPESLIQATPFSALTSLFLRNVIYSRNEMIMEALFQLEAGNIDSALSLVSEAQSLFDCELSYINPKEGKKPQAQHCWYLPGLLFMNILCCVLNDNAALRKHIPANLSLAFSRALNSSAQELRDYCLNVWNTQGAPSGEIWNNKTEAVAEWSDLREMAFAGQVKQSSSAEPHLQPWACMYFTALWETFCPGNQCTLGASLYWIELSSKMPAKGALTPIGQILWPASSLSRLGICFNYGIGSVAKDINKAVSFYKTASAAGDARAMCNLGACYENGTGVGRDVIQAASLYQKAADAGNANAMFILGTCFENGTGVEKDIQKAVANYQRAASAGNVRAMCSLGVCYQNGTGIIKNVSKAASLYQRAADAGDPSATFNLGLCYDNGTGVVKDSSKAASLYQRAADAGNSRAMCNLGVCYEYGTGVFKVINKAVSLYQRAADAGEPRAMGNLGVCYENGTGVEKDLSKAVSFYKKAADAGDIRAMCSLGMCYKNGTGVVKNFRLAVGFLQKAADAGDPRAMSNLGACYDYGTGVPEDLYKAVSFYKRAANLGNKYAIDRLGIIYKVSAVQAKKRKWFFWGA